MDEEIDLFPAIDQKRILFLHIPPYAEPTLRDYFNDSDRIGISVWDFDLDYTEMLDTAHPLEALADKMLLNIYNGDYSRKSDAITEMIRKYDPDGVIGFCSWGCRQSAGGIQLMKKKVLELEKPMLILDGDDVDRRNCPDGQIKTRFEAFLEELGVPTIHEKPEGRLFGPCPVIKAGRRKVQVFKTIHDSGLCLQIHTGRAAHVTRSQNRAHQPVRLIL